MKRCISLLLVVTILVCSVIPASAAESPYINVLDYALPNGGDSYNATVNTEDNIVSFDMSEFVAYRDIDITAYFSYNAVNGVTFISSGGVRTPLTVTRLASGVYKIQGETGSTYGGSFKLEFDVTRSVTIGFLSVKVNSIASSVFDETGTCDISSLNYQNTINFNSADTVNGRTFVGTANYEYNYLILDAKVDDWKLYDRLDIVLYVKCSDINSISCFIGNQVIEDVTIGIVNEPNWVINNYYISVSIDLSEINKKGNNYAPTLHIEGAVAPDLDNIVQVISMAGILNGMNVNPVVYWLQKLYVQIDSNVDVTWRWLSMIWDAISGNSTPGNEFTDEMEGKNEELDNIANSIGSVSKPSIDSINPIGNITNTGANIVGGVGPVLTNVMSNDVFAPLFLMVLTFALVAYVLYGKR